jgi:Mrp family chromosome partitioning ATPase
MNALVEGGHPVELVEAVPAMPSLTVLPSGPFTPNSAELLRLPAMATVLEELADAFDFVVIDGPPLLPVADAQVLLQNPAIDVVLIVGRPYLTTREHVRSAIAVLKRHPEKGFGLVLNGVREPNRGYYGYTQQRDADRLALGEDGIVGSSPGSRSAADEESLRKAPLGARVEDLDAIVDPGAPPD